MKRDMLKLLQNFRDNPNLGDGNPIVSFTFSGKLFYFRDNPNLGDGNSLIQDYYLFMSYYFRDNPNLGDGNLHK